MNTLSTEQINQIQQFISKRGFTYTDLSLEIVDHVACKVEEKMDQDPNMSFEEALQRSHADFGVMGFSVLEDSFTASLERKYRLLIFDELKSWFAFKHIGLVIGFLVFLFGLTQTTPYPSLSIFAIVLNIGLLLNYLIFYRKKLKQFKNMVAMRSATGYTFLLTTIIQVWVLSARFETYSDTLLIGQITIYNMLFPVLLLINIFAVRSIFLILKNSIARCEELAKHLV